MLIKGTVWKQEHSEGMVSACKDRSVPHHHLAHLQMSLEVSRTSGTKKPGHVWRIDFKKNLEKLLKVMFYCVNTQLIA